ncbi:hypothetical protein EO087_13365 [Dyella sp. M7H15-1]|uniref:type III secretion system chaperone n=1 Tax=Dyella sp. M7H15-1 TaxID=2501295 RepID=UPI0010052241|nr:type III secretion system chaperone [Dyella sp. M7H15-1]QAU24856.1 hypothetical protein EO087_13365 [Dyella sp. M7H15-1]
MANTLPIEKNKFSELIVEAMRKLNISEEKISRISEKLEVDAQYEAPIYCAFEIDNVSTMLKWHKSSGVERVDAITVVCTLPRDHRRPKVLETLLEYNYKCHDGTPAHFGVNGQDEILMYFEQLLVEINAKKLVDLIMSAIYLSKRFDENYAVNRNNYEEIDFIKKFSSKA